MEYVLASDGDGHWYVIPVEKQKAWWKWADDEDNWDIPEYAEYVNGPVSNVRFKDYRIE